MSPEMKWREGSRFKGDAQAVGEAIAEIASLHGGVCPPEVFLHEAMDESHPAHDDFEWDDDKAAYAYRLEQARRIIKSVTIVKNGSEIPQFFNVTISKNGQEHRGYMDQGRVLSNSGARSDAVKTALRQLRGWRKRYGIFTELQPIWDAIDSIPE